MAEKTTIEGKEEGGRWENEADRVTASKMKPNYESKEFTIGAETDYSIKDNENAFVRYARCHTAIIRTDADVTIKLNLNTNDSITLLAAEGVLTLDIVEITDIFFTTAGANIKVLLV